MVMIAFNRIIDIENIDFKNVFYRANMEKIFK